MNRLGPATDGDFPLIVASAFNHPDGAFRANMRARVQQLIDDFRPRYSVREVRAFLRREHGTILEPFVLNDADVDVATTIIRLAFSQRMAQTRVRVVSRETIGAEGGFVITDNLRGYYAERFALGKYRHTPAGKWFVAPAALPITAKIYADQRHAKALIILDERGIHLTVPWLDQDGTAPAVLARNLQRSSRVRGTRHSLATIGLRVEAGNREIEVRTGSPEALIQLMALCMNGAILELDPGGSGEGYVERLRSFVRLGVPQSAPKELPTVTTVTSGFPYPWLHAPMPTALSLSRDERLAVATWLPMHYSWIEELLEDVL